MYEAQVTRRVAARPVSRPGPGDVVHHLDILARLMDDLVRIPGLRVRVGLDPVVGLIPGLGNVATTAMSLMILIGAAYAGVPRITLLRMALNVALDMAISAIPVLGNAFDVLWRANQRNMALLRRSAPAAGRPVQRATVGDWAFVGGVIGALIALFVGIVVIVAWFVSQLARIVIG